MATGRQSSLWKTLSRINILVFVMLGVCAHAQEKSSPARNQDANTQIEGPRCNGRTKCVDAGSYTATTTDVWLGVTPKARQIRLILRFENMTEQTIFLAYWAHSIFVLDNFGNRYFCCQGENAPDSSAVGIGTDQGDKVDPQFMLKPHESAIASFDLWTHRVNPVASYYDIDVMIDEIDPTDRNAVAKRRFLPFRRVLPAIRNNQE